MDLLFWDWISKSIWKVRNKWKKADLMYHSSVLVTKSFKFFSYRDAFSCFWNRNYQLLLTINRSGKIWTFQNQFHQNTQIQDTPSLASIFSMREKTQILVKMVHLMTEQLWFMCLSDQEVIISPDWSWSDVLTNR